MNKLSFRAQPDFSGKYFLFIFFFSSFELEKQKQKYAQLYGLTRHSANDFCFSFLFTLWAQLSSVQLAKLTLPMSKNRYKLLALLSGKIMSSDDDSDYVRSQTIILFFIQCVSVTIRLMDASCYTNTFVHRYDAQIDCNSVVSRKMFKIIFKNKKVKETQNMMILL